MSQTESETLEPMERFYQYLAQRGQYVYLKPEDIASICGIEREEVGDIVRTLINEGKIKFYKRSPFGNGCWAFKAIPTPPTDQAQTTESKHKATCMGRVSTPCMPRVSEGVSSEYFEGVNLEPPARVHRLCFVLNGYLSPNQTAFLREHAQIKPKDASQWYTGEIPYCKYQVSKRGKLRLFLEREGDNITRGLECFGSFMSENGYNLNGEFDYASLNSKGTWHAEFGYKASGAVQRFSTTSVRLQLANSKVKVLTAFDKSLDDCFEYDVKVFDAPSPKEAQTIADNFANSIALMDEVEELRAENKLLRMQLEHVQLSLADSKGKACDFFRSNPTINFLNEGGTDLG